MTKTRTLLLGLSFAALLPAMAQNETKEYITDNVRFCESTYPYNSGILIANFGSKELSPLNNEGKGYILLHENGKTSTFIANDGYLNAPKGMLISDGKLYVCDVNKIAVYDLDNRSQKPAVINLPKGDMFVNDIVEYKGKIYVSVTNTGKIYQIDPASGNSVREWAEVTGANGLLIVNGKMYIASYPPSGETGRDNVLYIIRNMENPEPEKFVNIPGQYDGLAVSTDKKSIYMSNWSPGELVKIDLSSRKKTVVCQELNGPADISVHEGKIYIPELASSRVRIIKE